jgi:hypothetical protein
VLKPKLLALQPAKYWVIDVATNLDIEDEILYSIIRAIVHHRWVLTDDYGAILELTTGRGKPKELGENPDRVPLCPPESHMKPARIKPWLP